MIKLICLFVDLKMQIEIICLILAMISITPSHGACFLYENGTRYCDVYTQWSSGENGAVAWAKDCDFVGHDLSKQDTLDTQCGKQCLETTQCTHFTWAIGICYLKSNPRQKAEEPSKLQGAICGYIRERTDFVHVGK
jgi:hypothetical protein